LQVFSALVIFQPFYFSISSVAPMFEYFSKRQAFLLTSINTSVFHDGVEELETFFMHFRTPACRVQLCTWRSSQVSFWLYFDWYLTCLPYQLFQKFWVGKRGLENYPNTFFFLHWH